MLISFSLRNYKSFRGRSELSTVARKTEKSIPGALIYASMPGSEGEAVLPAVAIYGANASGKSNFLLGLSTMRTAVIKSQADWKPGTRIPVDPHAALSEQPTEFEIQMLIDGVRYRYGFSASSEAIWSEWLFSYPVGRERMLFRRTTREDPENYFIEIDVGSSFSGAKREHDSTVKRVRNNSLILSGFAQDNQKECSKIYSWFNNRVITKTNLDFSSREQSLTSVLACDHDNFKALLEPLMRMSDSSIKEISVRDLTGPLSPTDPGFLDRMKTLSVKFKLSDGQDEFEVDFKNESRGVKRLYELAAPLITALAHGYTIIIDELETSMHAHVASQLLALFQNSSSNPNGAQIIFTTHETRLLNLQHLRRDQIWFCEKLGVNSELYPLLEFSPRKDDNFEAGYLKGRYGAVPQAVIDPSWISRINDLNDNTENLNEDGSDAS